MRYPLLITCGLVSTLSLGIVAKTASASGVFDWMSPGKWLNNGDHDRDYYHRGYNNNYNGYNYYPGWGGYNGYPNYAYPGGYPATGWGYPLAYPSYSYPIQSQQIPPAATAPTPQ